MTSQGHLNDSQVRTVYVWMFRWHPVSVISMTSQGHVTDVKVPGFCFCVIVLSRHHLKVISVTAKFAVYGCFGDTLCLSSPSHLKVISLTSKYPDVEPVTKTAGVEALRLSVASHDTCARSTTAHIHVDTITSADGCDVCISISRNMSR